MQPVSHIIFDMDGLLLDTEKLYTDAIQELVGQYGKQYTWEIKTKCMGMGDKAANIIIEELNLPISFDQYFEMFHKISNKLFLASELLPGADRLVKHLAKHNIPIAIASGSSQESFDLKTTNHKEFISHFHHVVLSSSDPEVKKGKPAPDVFQICADRFPDKPAYSKCLVFEDAPLGVTAGVSAGMQVVMVPDSRMDPNLTKEANIVLTSLEEFKPELFGLPAFD